MDHQQIATSSKSDSHSRDNSVPRREMNIHQSINYPLDIILPSDTESSQPATPEDQTPQEYKDEPGRRLGQHELSSEQQQHASRHLQHQNDASPPPLSPSLCYWHHLPADMIFTIASSLDGRSLAQLERTDRSTYTTVTKHSILLWRALAEKPESKTRWMKSEQREQLNKFQQNEAMARQRQENPKQYFTERMKLIQGFHYHLLVAQKSRLHSTPFKKRSLALRWYDEVVLPICLFILLLLFVSFLIYQLHTNDDVVTWMAMSPLLIFLGLILLSTYLLFVIRCRGHVNQLSSGKDDYDIEHLIPNDYAHESQSCISIFTDSVIHPIRPVGRGRIRPMVLQEIIPRYILASLIFLGFVTCIVFLSLRVTGTVEWPWPLIFTPFFISTGLVWFIGCFPDQTFADAASILVAFSPFIIFIVLLTVYLNNGGSTSSLRLNHVFIPLYIIDGITFFFSFLGIVTFLSVHCFRCCRDGSVRDFSMIGLFAWIGWVVVIAPLLWMKIILGLRADRDDGEKIVSNLALFLPLLLPTLLLIGVAIIYMSDQGGCRSLINRPGEIEEEARRAAQEPKVPATLEEIENDESFVPTSVWPVRPVIANFVH